MGLFQVLGSKVPWAVSCPLQPPKWLLRLGPGSPGMSRHEVAELAPAPWGTRTWNSSASLCQSASPKFSPHGFASEMNSGRAWQKPAPQLSLIGAPLIIGLLTQIARYCRLAHAHQPKEVVEM